MNNKNYRSGSKPRLHIALVFAIAFLLLVVPVSASGESGPYLTFTGSIDNFGDVELTNIDPGLTVGSNIGKENGFGFNNSIGYQFKNSFSTELEFSYKSGEFEPGGGLDGEMTSMSVMLNGIYSFNIREFYTPYLGYGIGLTTHEAELKQMGDRSDGTLAYQVKAGVDMEFSRKLSLILGYRYFKTSNPDFKTYFTADSSSHSIEA
ncbi:uncharacterized protein METZ01_LOCUS486238, partial [marine metagenome]